MHITDPSDSRLDDFRNLKRNERGGLVIAEGPLITGRLLRSRFPVRKIVGFPKNVEEFLAQNPIGDEVEVLTLNRETLAAVAGYDMHRGLLASADRAESLTITQAIQGARTVAVLEGVGDHENIGSMFRNGASMGVDAVLFGNGCADPLFRRSVRVSMGHVLCTPFAHFEGKSANWHHSMAQLREAGFRLVSLTPDASAEHLASALVDDHGKPYEKVALLVGAEGPGLTERTMRYTDVRARIPMESGTDSINLATAAAIAFYERGRSLIF